MEIHQVGVMWGGHIHALQHTPHRPQDTDSRHVTRKGMRTVLKAIAQVVLELHDKPVWKRLYEEDTWAWSEGDETWKVRFTAEASDKDRERVIRSAKWEGVHLRTDHPHIYRWAYAPRYRST